MRPFGLRKLIIASMAVVPAWVSVPAMAAEIPSTRPASGTQPIAPQQPMAAKLPVPTTQPVMAQQPPVAPQPAPVPATQPAVAVQQPAPVPNPTPAPQPIAVKVPTPIPQPAPATQPSIAIQPPAPIQNPAPQPVAVKAPTPVPPPAPATQPVVVQQPAPVQKPAPATQPVAVKAPTPVQNPAPVQPPAPLPSPVAAKPPVPEADLLRIENQLLKDQIRGMQRELLSYQSFVTNMGENALRAPFGRLLLIRRAGLAAAIMITEHTRPVEVQLAAGRVRSRKGARYSFWIQKDGSADFSKPNVVKGAAEVFEEENGINANAFMNLDGLKLHWSMSDWIGFPEEFPDLEMSITEQVRIEDVRFDDPACIWMSRGKLQDFARSLRRVLAEPAATTPSAS